ncbi:outer membrane beta-barrel protein [Cyclobacterium sp.]|uniref:TonB-dependent receptor n=1 Tax=Cyclobacterium sp. TaxID=1966343 RepID=UPI0019A8877E|nr:outer membrane beta-barrel protein [Cyclobacterium sp.]MBD3627569.1 TonB-dependent receptor [Cyclobacterium sp.]
MKFHLPLFTVLFVFFSFATLYGQQNYSGTIIDSQTKEPLFGAYVFLKDGQGETLSSSYTDFDGKFQVKKPGLNEFLVELSFIGYKTYQEMVKAPEGSNLGTFELVSDGQEMDVFEFSADALTGEVRGDTVAFNANAFKTRPQADADELVRKMPGVVIQNGVIEVQGEEVMEVLVDGRPFFGDNPAAALKNLPAQVVLKIEFLDQKSDEARLTGFDDGETTKTINIITKPGMRAGRFGKFYGGYGTDNNYIAGGNMNFFNEAQRLSILGLSNNINQQNFGEDELGNIEGDDSRRGGNELAVGELPGITNTNAVGVNFSDEYQDEKLKVTGNYLFNDRDNVLTRTSSREYILPNDSLQIYQEDRNNQTRTQSHRMSARIDYTINERHALILRPRIGLDYRKSTNIRDARNLFDANTPISSNINTTTSERQSLNFRNSLNYRYNFTKEGRALSTYIYTSTYDSDSQSDLVAVNENFQTGNIDSLIQFRNNLYSSFYYSSGVSYFEPISERSRLRIGYRLSNNASDTDQEVEIQEAETDMIRLDSALTNRFENQYMTHRGRLGYSYNSEKLSIYSTVSYESASIDSDRLFPGFENTQRKFANLLPRVVVNYQLGEFSNMRVDYNTDTDAPSIRQLQDVISNANPLQISNGNPDLVQEYSHRLFTRFRKINPETNRSLMFFLYGNIRNNYIGNETFVAAKDTLIQKDVLLNQGGQYTRPVNLDNYYVFRLYGSYGFPLKFMKSNLNINSSYTVRNRPGIINGQENFNTNTTFSQGFNLSSNINERIDFNLSTRGNFSGVSSSLQQDLDNNYYTHRTRADLFWNFLGGIFVGTSVNHQVYTGLGEDFDRSIMLVNLDLGYRIPPSNKTEIKLTVFDLLNQNVSIDRNVTDVYIEDERTQVLRQFFMLSITYNLRRFGGYDMAL